MGPRAYAEYPLQSGQTATFNVYVVQGATATVRIDTLATTSVADAPVTYRTGLLVRPNPSRGKVEFVAQLAVPGQLKLEVYDVAGRLVAEPFNGPVTAGLHVVQWDAQGGGSMNARTGLYFVRMKAGTRVFTRRLMATFS